MAHGPLANTSLALRSSRLSVIASAFFLICWKIAWSAAKPTHVCTCPLFACPCLPACLACQALPPFAPAPPQGSLANLDSQQPCMYIDFPNGRLKLFGTLVFPRNKCVTDTQAGPAGRSPCT